MKTFLMINGKYSATFKAENMQEAKEKAIKASDNSLEIIVREITYLWDGAKMA